jgi:tRNA(fMet)-specific endonuclease VapC
MDAFVLDTSTITQLQRGHPRVTQALAAHAGDFVAVTPINVEESLGGWYTLLRRARTPDQEVAAYQLLADAVTLLGQFPIVPLTRAARDRYDQLARLKLRVGRMDLLIAAIALEVGATVVTNNVADFRRVPGLQWVDWSA